MPHATPPDTHRNFARAMRDGSTKAENMLWQELRNRQMDGHKFRRQVLKRFPCPAKSPRSI